MTYLCCLVFREQKEEEKEEAVRRNFRGKFKRKGRIKPLLLMSLPNHHHIACKMEKLLL